LPTQRIFDLRAAFHADDDTSGIVLGVDGGDCVLRSCWSSGGEEGLDRFLHFLVEVFLVKAKDQRALSVLVRVLFVIHPAT
jgi:hypothetical protein